MKHVCLFSCLLATAACFGQAGKPVVTFINPPGLAAPKGYSTTVEVDLGTARMIIISGIVATDPQGNVVGKGDFASQTEQVFTKIKMIVEHAGGKMQDVVKLGNFLKDMTQLQTFRNIRDKYVNLKNPPASTTVEVSKLVTDDFLLEVEATAIIQNARP